jgi:hydrogenase maturation protease
MNQSGATTAVLGLGNILHSDDGVGPCAVQRLLDDARVPEDVVVIEGGTLGLELLTYIWDAARLVVVDAVDVGQSPGTIVRMSGDELHKLPGGGSVHQLGVADLMVALQILAKQPPEVVLYGVQPASTEWGVSLSPAVEAALNPLLDMVLEELCRGSQTELQVAG